MGAAVKRKPRRVQVGRRRQVVGRKGGEKKQKQPSIASNSTPSIATARMVYLWSWGPIVGPVDGLRSIKLDGTPVMAADGTLNYPGVKWQFRSGELNQERLEGVSESSNEIDVQHELISTAPYLYTVSNSMVDAVRVRLAWPQLQSQDSSGNINGVLIKYAIDVSTDNGPYLEVLASEVDRKNITKYERSHRIELPAGDRWTLRVRRITPEANSSLVSDGMLVEAVGEVVDSDQEYPLTAVSCVEYDAQQFGGDIAKIAVLMRGRIVQVPANYDPATRTYATAGPGTSNGIWDGTWKEAWTDCPPWIFRDLALHPYYGLGDRIDLSMIDHWSLYRIAQFCDQFVPDGKGGQQPRFTCNLYLQKQAEAWAVLQDLAAIFHGLAFWDGSQIVVNADMPQDPVYTYTLSQILGDGAIRYTGSKARDRHSLAMVTWDNPDQGYESDKEPVFDDEAIAELGVRELSVEAVGCTVHGQAQRAGAWALATEQLQTRGATFRVGLDGHIPRPGQVIALSDPMLAGRANGGRVASAAGRVVTLDRDIDVPVGARLLVNLPSGKTEARQVRSVAGRQVTVMADFSESPQPEAGWALDFDDLKLMQFYVRNITRPEWHQFQLEVIQHEPSKFDAIDYGTVIDDRPISVLPPGVQDAPAQVLITSHVSVDQGIAVSTMTIGWSAAPGAVAYDVEWRWGSRDWIKLPRTGELAADVRGVYAGQYLARVRAVSAMDVSSMPTVSMLTEIAGKTGLPPAVAFLNATPLVFGTRLSWGFPAGAEDTERTEIWQSATTNRDDAIRLGDFAYPQAEHEIHGLAAGVSFFYWARLVDRSGNIGQWYPTGVGVNGQSSADAALYEEYFKDKIGEGALYQSLRDEIALISGSGAGSVNARLQALGISLQEQIDAIADLADSMPYDPEKTYVADQAVLGDNGHLYQALQAVPVNTPPPNVTYWTDIGQAVRTANGLAVRVTSVETKVTEHDGQLAAQSSRIDGVQSTLAGKADASTVTSIANRVTQTEQGLASQGTAITGLTNTVAGKADASTVQALSNTVTQQGNTITSQGGSIVALQNSVGNIGAGGLDVAPNSAWQFDATAEGWTAASATVTATPGKITVLATANYPILLSPSVSINGALYSRLKARITRRAGAASDWDGSLYYETASHGFSANYRGAIANPNLAVGQSAIIECDLAALAAGGTDWVTSTITRVRLDLGTNSGGSLEIDWIAVGRLGPAASASVLQSVATTVTQQGNTLTSQGNSINEMRNTVAITGAGGLDVAVSGMWHFDNDAQGWYAAAATISHAAGSITVTATANNPVIVSPVTNINGALYSRIRIKVTRRAGAASDWDGSVYYETPGHSFSASYRGALANPNLSVGQSAVIECDMAALVIGGNDWVTSTISRLRLDLGVQAGGALEIDWISVGRLAPGASTAALRQTNTVVTAQGEAITAQASRIDGIQTQVGNNSAAVQQVSEAVADLNGDVSAMTTIKAETIVGGRKVMAGLALGSDGVTSEILAFAQRFAIVDEVTGQLVLPFVVQGGQVFMNTAIINTAFIQQIVAAMTIRSAALNSQGLPLLEINFAAGTFVLRGQDANGSTLLHNGGLYVYDNGGIERAAIGRLT